MTNKLRILPLIVALVLLGAIVIQNAMASICFDCPDADVDVAEAENTISTSSGTNQSSTRTNSTG